LADSRSSDRELLSAAAGDDLPGVIALNSQILTNPWETAGRIFHESAHMKLFDISRCSALTRYPWEAVAVPWRSSPWSLVRGLVSFHVYAHMLLFQRSVEKVGRRLSRHYGRPPAAVAVSRSSQPQSQYESAEQRFAYLADRLVGDWSGHLTPAGADFVDWVAQTVIALR